MILKLRDKLLGGHVHVDVFVGPDADHLALSGKLVFRAEEWQALIDGTNYARKTLWGFQVIREKR